MFKIVLLLFGVFIYPVFSLYADDIVDLKQSNSSSNCEPPYSVFKPCRLPTFKETQQDLDSISSNHSILDEVPVAFPSSNPLSQKNIFLLTPDEQLERRAITEAKYVQIFNEHPDIYWAFEFAGHKNPKAYKYFEQTIKKDEITKDAYKIVSDIGVVGPYGVSMNMPDFTKMKRLRPQSAGPLSYYKPSDSKIKVRAKQLSPLFLMCEGEGFGGCDAFHDFFKDKNIDSNSVEKRFNKAQKYALKVKKDFPDSKDLETMRELYPTEASLISDLQKARNTDDTQQQLSAIEKALAIKKVPSFDQIENNIEEYEEITTDPQWLKLEQRREKVNDIIENIDDQLSSTNKAVSIDAIKKLRVKQDKFQEEAKQIEKEKSIYKHEKHINKMIAWTQTINVVASTVGIPKKAIKVGLVTEQSLKIYKSVKSMFIAGALDPTGIMAITSAVGFVMKLFSNTPSHEEVVMKKLDALLKGQKEILNQLAKMDHKLDQINQSLNYITQLMNKNHQEILANFTDIKNQLNGITNQLTGITNQLTNIQWDIKEGFADAKLTDVQNKHIEKMMNAITERESLFYYQKGKYQSEEMDKKMQISGEKQLLALSNYSKSLTNGIHQINFATLSRKEIQKYLANPIIENRIPFLNSMIKWLNNTKEREKLLFRGSIEETLINAKKMNVSDAEYKKIANRLEQEFNPVFKKITFGYPILFSIKPKDLMYAQYQDEVFSEYVDLNSLFQPTWQTQHEDRDNLLESVKKDPYISSMCQRLSSIELASQTMRKNLQTAWNIYMFYFSSIYQYTHIFINPTIGSPSDIPAVSVKLKTLQPINQIVKDYKKFLKAYNLHDVSYPSSFYTGEISSNDILTAIAPVYGYLKTSDIFLHFDNIVSNVFWDILKDWKILMVRSHGYYKPKVGGYGGYIGDLDSFIKVQTQHWRWYLRPLYFSIIQRLNRHNLIVNWMRAYLAVDTMARIGFGEELIFHPQFAVFQKLMSKFKPKPEPITVPERFNPQKPTKEYFTPYDFNKVVKFFQYVEIFGDRKSNLPMVAYANRAKQKLELDSVDGFIPKKYLPKCNNYEERVAVSISNAKKVILFLEPFKNSAFSKDKSNAMYLLSRVQNWLQEIISSGTYIDIKKKLMQTTQFQPVLNFINEQDNYINWNNPVCEEVLQDLSKWSNQIRKNFDKHNNYHLLFPIPLPDESTWAGRYIGLGNVHLREQALMQASGYHKPSNLTHCPLKN